MIEWIAAVFMTLAALNLHLIFLRHAGPLWRDEVSSVDLANLPGFSSLWAMLTHDSFPLLWSLVLRFWDTIGFGDSDMHLRWLGFVIGLLLLASIWIASRMIRGPAPVVALAFFALNAGTLWAGDSLRAYGLGTALIILTLAFIWRLYESPTLSNAFVTALLATLSVQCLYQNSFLLLASGLSASFLAIRRRRWRPLVFTLASGLLAALSLLPYLPEIARSQDWWILEKTGFAPLELWRKASQALGFPFPWYNLLWPLLATAAVAIGCTQLFLRPLHEKNLPRQEAAAFAGFSLLFGVGGFILFLKVAGLPTQPWYYLPIMGLAAVCFDRVLLGFAWSRGPLLAIAIATAAISYEGSLPLARRRQTNIDLLAAQLEREARPNDIIVLDRWYCGVTFQRYYHGSNFWTTLPPLQDLSIHRYDQMKLAMQKEDAIQPVIARVDAALRAGGRVWLIGEIPFDGRPPPLMEPAPNNPWRWLDFPYTEIWGGQLGYFIVNHASSAEAFPLTEAVNPLEDLQIAAISGWRP
jgi:hypothetical protein